MNANVTLYKPRLSVMGGGLVIFPLLFFGLTLPLIIEGAPVPMEQLLGSVSYSGHALDQMQNRGIPPSIVENTIKTGSKYATEPGTVGYFDPVNSVRVVQNQDTKQVITVIRGEPKGNGP
jgi:hypothetical protein